jgi:hypothetical protein
LKQKQDLAFFKLKERPENAAGEDANGKKAEQDF